MLGLALVLSLGSAARAAPATDPYAPYPELIRLRTAAIELAQASYDDREARAFALAQLDLSPAQLDRALHAARQPLERVVEATFGPLPTHGGGCTVTGFSSAWSHTAGPCVDGAAAGLGVAEHPDGSARFIGQFASGRPLEGVLEVDGRDGWRWVGPVALQDGVVPHGPGVLTRRRGGYVGAMDHGRYHGSGLLTDGRDRLVMATHFDHGVADGWTLLVRRRSRSSGIVRSVSYTDIRDGQAIRGLYLDSTSSMKSSEVRIGAIHNDQWSGPILHMYAGPMFGGFATTRFGIPSTLRPADFPVGLKDGPALRQAADQSWEHMSCRYPRGCRTAEEWRALAQQQAENRAAFESLAETAAVGLGGAAVANMAGMTTEDALVLGVAMGADHATGGVGATDMVLSELDKQGHKTVHRSVPANVDAVVTVASGVLTDGDTAPVPSQVVADGAPTQLQAILAAWPDDCPPYSAPQITDPTIQLQCAGVAMLQCSDSPHRAQLTTLQCAVLDGWDAAVACPYCPPGP